MTFSKAQIALAAGILVTATMGSSLELLAAEPKWSDEPYNFIVVDQDVRDTLAEFGRNTGTPLQVSPKVKGQVRGKLPTLPPKEFLTRLSEDFGLTWYYDGSMLHINAASESATEILRPAGGSVADAKARLDRMGLLDERYDFRISPDGTSVTVSGPPAYRAAVQGILSTMTVDRVRVFKGTPAAS